MFNAEQNPTDGAKPITANKLGVPINLNMECSRSYSSGIDTSKPTNNRLRVHSNDSEPLATCLKVRSNPTSPNRGSKSQYLTRMHKKWSNRALHASSSSEYDPTQHNRQQSSNYSTDSNNCDQLDIPGVNSDSHIDPNSRLSLSQQHLLHSQHSSSPLFITQSSSCHNLNPNQSQISSVVIGTNTTNHLSATNPNHLFLSSSSLTNSCITPRIHNINGPGSANFLVKQFAVEDETQPDHEYSTSQHFNTLNRHAKMMQLKQNHFLHHNQASSLENNPRSSSLNTNSEDPQTGANLSAGSSALLRHSTRSLANTPTSIGSSNAPINFKKALRDRWYYSNSHRPHPHHQNSSTNTTFSSTNSSSFTQNPNSGGANLNGNNHPSSFSESEDNSNSRLKCQHNKPSSVIDSVDNQELPTSNHDYSTSDHVTKDTMTGVNSELRDHDNSSSHGGGQFKIKTSLSLDLLHLNNPNKYRLQSTNSTISSVSGVEPEEDPFSPATTTTDICSPLLRLNLPNHMQHQTRLMHTNNSGGQSGAAHGFNDGSGQSKLTMSSFSNRNEARQFFPDNIPLTEHLQISSLATNSTSSLALLGVPHSNSISSNGSMSYFRNNRGFTSLTTSPVRASNGCHGEDYRLSQVGHLDSRTNGTSTNHALLNSRSMDYIDKSDDNPPLLTPEVYPIEKQNHSKSSIKKVNMNAAKKPRATSSEKRTNHKMRQRSHTLPCSSSKPVYSRSAVSPTSSASTVRKCDVCGRIFSRSDMLARHSRVHTGLRPFVCPVCDQSFSRSDHLGTHMRIHSGEKPYRCSLCDYSACRRDMITRHLRVHRRKGDITGDFSPNSLVVHNSNSNKQNRRRGRYKHTTHSSGHLRSSFVQQPHSITTSNVSGSSPASSSSTSAADKKVDPNTAASSQYMGPFMTLLDGGTARDHDDEDEADERPGDMGMPFGSIFISICQPTPRSSFSVPPDQNLS